MYYWSKHIYKIETKDIYYSGYTLLVHILKLVMPIAPLTILEKLFSLDGNRWRPPSTAIWAKFSLLWLSLVFDWALFRTINVDQRGGKTESER